MIKGTPELIADRREQIVNACGKLYMTMSFRDITLKEIGNEVPFSRPTIYNYFQNKEEIFLVLFKREYDLWNSDLCRILTENETLEKDRAAALIARSLEKRPQLLKLLSMNNFDMEAASRREALTSFKRSYGESLANVRMIIERSCPEFTEKRVSDTVYTFFPFMFGIYPYTAVTDKQRAAMEEAGVGYSYMSVYEIVYACLSRLLGAETGEAAI